MAPQRWLKCKEARKALTVKKLYSVLETGFLMISREIVIN